MTIHAKYAIARINFWILRFKSLQRGKRLFGSVKTPTFLKRSLFGYAFIVDISRTTTHQLLYLEGERFIEERLLVSKLLKRGMNVVDVGANIGYYLLLIEKCISSKGKVFLVEPSPENLPELRKNIEINKFQNVTLFEVAIGMEDGSSGLKSGINSGIADSGQGAYEVEIRRLDSLIEDRIDFIKIDVEGFEGQVLKGAREIIKRDRPVLFIEMHPHIVGRYGFSSKGILEELSQQYESIFLYKTLSSENLSIAQKIKMRYFAQDTLVRIENISNFLEACSSEKLGYTFWAVCRPPVLG